MNVITKSDPVQAIRDFLRPGSSVPRLKLRNDKLLRSSLKRLGERLQSLENQNLTIAVLLQHKLHELDALPLPPKYLPIVGHFHSTLGAKGALADTTIQTVSPIGRIMATRLIQNESMIASNRCYFLNPVAGHEISNWNLLKDQFFVIAKELGQQIVGMVGELFESHQCWRMWEQPPIFWGGNDGVWIDFVFETGWKSVPEIPLQTTKKVYWSRTDLPLDAIPELEELYPQLEKSLNMKLPIIPKPVASWYSEISDIVSASQHAVDYLLSIVPDVGQLVGPTESAEFKDLIRDVESKLNGNSLKLFMFLKNEKHQVTYATLRENIWRERTWISDEGIKAAIERLQQALNEMKPMKFEVYNQFANRRVQLKALTK